jgi:hypothetical protein
MLWQIFIGAVVVPIVFIVLVNLAETSWKDR